MKENRMQKSLEARLSERDSVAGKRKFLLAVGTYSSPRVELHES